MLPDLPTIKRDLQKVFDDYFKREVQRRLGVFEESPRHIIHEGQGLSVSRADGTVDESGLKAASAEFSLRYEDVPNQSLLDRLQHLDRVAEDMATQISRNLFDSLNETLDKAGQVVDQRGKPLDGNSILAVLEKMNVDFDDNGQHVPLTIVTHPNLQKAAQQAFQELECNPVLSARHGELMRKKQADWRDREASRKLVG